MKGTLAFPKPKDKTVAYPVVHVYPDGREECSYLAAGRAEYARRTTLMLDRQNGICCLHGHAPMCTGHLRRQGATFEHEQGRGHGGGKHDDRTELPDGTWINGAAHWECNNWKGSRYIDYNHRFREGASMTDTAVPQMPDCLKQAIAAIPDDQIGPVYAWAVSAGPSNYVSLAIQDATQGRGNDVYE